jgi:hypothetical protein
VWSVKRHLLTRAESDPPNRLSKVFLVAARLFVGVKAKKFNPWLDSTETRTNSTTQKQHTTSHPAATTTQRTAADIHYILVLSILSTKGDFILLAHNTQRGQRAAIHIFTRDPVCEGNAR